MHSDTPLPYFPSRTKHNWWANYMKNAFGLSLNQARLGLAYRYGVASWKDFQSLLNQTDPEADDGLRIRSQWGLSESEQLSLLQACATVANISDNKPFTTPGTAVHDLLHGNFDGLLDEELSAMSQHGEPLSAGELLAAVESYPAMHGDDLPYLLRTGKQQGWIKEWVNDVRGCTRYYANAFMDGDWVRIRIREFECDLDLMANIHSMKTYPGPRFITSKKWFNQYVIGHLQQTMRRLSDAGFRGRISLERVQGCRVFRGPEDGGTGIYLASLQEELEMMGATPSDQHGAECGQGSALGLGLNFGD